MSKLLRLTAREFLKLSKDHTRLTTRVVLTPISWIATSLAHGVESIEWSANGSRRYPSISCGRKRCDLLLCLPGASMGIITMEEAIAAGAKEFFFVGTASSIEGKIPFGSVRFNDSVVSVLNPYQEHEEWNEIRRTHLVDMEAEFLKKLATKRGVRFQHALIVSDAIWEDRWEQASLKSRAYTTAIKDSLDMIADWISK